MTSERITNGKVAGDHPAGPCPNNPDYRNFVMGLFEDYARSYDIDGVLWGVEQQGPMSNALGAYHDGTGSDPGRVTCFCEFCVAKGKRQGIDVERVKTGFRELEQYVRAGRAGQRPIDGYYVTFWRILLRNPEILQWQELWTENTHDIHRGIFQTTKSVNPRLQAETGFTADYVYRETKRGLDNVAGTKTEMWPGIDIDVPTPGGKSKSTPENVRESVIAIMRAGAQGVLLSRTYTEMKIENLAGCGNAMRELGLV